MTRPLHSHLIFFGFLYTSALFSHLLSYYSSGDFEVCYVPKSNSFSAKLKKRTRVLVVWDWMDVVLSIYLFVDCSLYGAFGDLGICGNE